MQIWNAMRNEYTDRLVLVFGVVAPVAVMMSLLRILSLGWNDAMYVHLMFGITAPLIAVFRKNINNNIKLVYLLSAMTVVGLSSLFTFGFASSGIFYFAGGAIITALTFGSRWALGYTIITGIIFALCGFYFITSHPTLPIDANALLLDPFSWLSNGVGYLSLLCVLSIIVGMMNETLCRTVTELTNKNTEIMSLAEHDKLTGLWNNRVVVDRLQYILDKRKRHPQTIFVLFMDLDGFKDINDSHGHAVGDTSLVITATRMRDTLRHEDTLARIGGDEFVAIIEIDVPPFSIEDIIKRLINSVSAPFYVDGNELKLGVSVGVAMVEPSDNRHYTPKMLLEMADKAMYSVKKNGKNSFIFGEYPETL